MAYSPGVLYVCTVYGRKRRKDRRPILLRREGMRVHKVPSASQQAQDGFARAFSLSLTIQVAPFAIVSHILSPRREALYDVMGEFGASDGGV